MSVLIKGMEMPKNCDECPLLTEDGDYDVCFAGKRRVMWEWKHDRGLKVIHPKPDWCPLIEVPPHGRLIDADAVERNLVKMQMAQKGVVGHGIRKSRAVVRDMPTVIPADKDGET